MHRPRLFVYLSLPHDMPPCAPTILADALPARRILGPTVHLPSQVDPLKEFTNFTLPEDELETFLHDQCKRVNWNEESNSMKINTRKAGKRAAEGEFVPIIRADDKQSDETVPQASNPVDPTRGNTSTQSSTPAITRERQIPEYLHLSTQIASVNERTTNLQSKPTASLTSGFASLQIKIMLTSNFIPITITRPELLRRWLNLGCRKKQENGFEGWLNEGSNGHQSSLYYAYL